jgi:hypothetical protein
MIYKEIDTTSSLRRERNINNPRTCIQNRNGKGIGNLCILFMECLLKRGIRDKMVLQWCTDLRPFFEYLEERHGVTTVTCLKRRHVEAYAALVRTGYEAGGKKFTDALDANGLLSAVRLFCLYLLMAGVVGEDYGYAAPVIPYPVSDLSERKE